MTSESTPDYNQIHSERAARLISNKDQPDLSGVQVLVVGANTGKDCRYFKEFGASEVHGLDVVDSTGADFQAPGVYYHIESAENMSLPGRSFDLVYCFATMEHIPRIELAFLEMARVTRPSGFIYCVSSPLWRSRYGHHMGEVFGESWVHLRMTPAELLAHCQRNNINEFNGKPINHTVNYLYDSRNMNQLPPQQYVDFSKDLPGIKTIVNHLDYEPEDSVTSDMMEELYNLGFPKKDILALTHTFIGRKEPDETLIVKDVEHLTPSGHGADSIRVAFLIPVTQSWLGGFNYFRNLLAAVLSVPERTVEPIVLGDLSHLGYPFKECESLPLLNNLTRYSWQWWLHKCGQGLLDNGGFVAWQLRRGGIQLLSHTSPLGKNCPVPTLGWIPDFQHRYYPEFFNEKETGARDNSMAYLARYARGVVLSSHEAHKDFCRFFPEAAHKAYVLQFVASPTQIKAADAQRIIQQFGLAEPYFHIPNQFWIHKNHSVVIEALRILKSRGQCPLVVGTGNTEDHRSPGFFQDLCARIAQYGLEERFRVLGIVKEDELSALMRNAMAMINPSLFEGWSTTVEEAKSLGKRILLSDIPVHREQAPERGVFFPPHEPEALADALQTVIENYDPAAEAAAARRAAAMLIDRQQAFGRAYEAIVKHLLSAGV
jgi:glycosyltransferase involved in cell wall biosynthesis